MCCFAEVFFFFFKQKMFCAVLLPEKIASYARMRPPKGDAAKTDGVLDSVLVTLPGSIVV